MRLKLSGIIKLVLGVATLLFLCRAFLSDAVLGSALLFLTVGLVPGTTDVRLAPSTILTALPFVFAGVVLIVMRREFWRLAVWLVRVIRRQPVTETTYAAEMAEAETSSVDAVEAAPDQSLDTTTELLAAETKEADVAVASELPLSASLTLAQRLLRQLRRLSDWLSPWLAQRFKRFQPTVRRLHKGYRKQSHKLLVFAIPHLDTLAYGLGVALGGARRYSLLSWRHLKRLAGLIIIVVRVESRNLTQFVGHKMVQGWRWLSPYLWRFDTWLGVQFNAFTRQPYIRQARRTIQDFIDGIVRSFKK